MTLCCAKRSEETMTRTLRKGYRGPDVLRWQQFLQAQGFTPGALDGAFGEKTAEATRAFQLASNLKADGVVGPNTYAAAAKLGLRSLRRLTNTELTPALIAEARRILKAHHADPFGTQVPFQVAGMSYVARIEEHYHPPGGARRPWGYHPGVSLFLDVLPDKTITLHDEQAPTDSGDHATEPVAPPINTTGVIVLDPGHGGTQGEAGSSANNARSPTGVLEKTLTLELATLVRAALEAKQPSVRVSLTRTADVNLGLEARARRARDAEADLFLSIHFNGFDGKARGVEAHVRPKAGGNVNFEADRNFASRICNAVHGALVKFDPATPLRGVKETNLGVLRDDWLGNSSASESSRACLLEVEFMDVPAVDQLFNTGPSAAQVRLDVAEAIATALLQELDAAGGGAVS
jgi:N-acetylmuramoyl-L-alanine amidase